MSFRHVPHLRDLSRAFVGQVLKPGDWALDGTAGNGHDTLFLVNLIGDAGKVFAFDIQQSALEKTMERLDATGVAHRCKFCLGGHERLLEVLPRECLGKLKASMFNFGYLPGSDKEITTKQKTSVEAIAQLMDFICPGGVISLHLYAGHVGGAGELKAITSFCCALPYSEWRIAQYSIINKQRNREVLILGEKRRVEDEDRDDPVAVVS